MSGIHELLMFTHRYLSYSVPNTPGRKNKGEEDQRIFKSIFEFVKSLVFVGKNGVLLPWRPFILMMSVPRPPPPNNFFDTSSSDLRFGLECFESFTVER